MALQHGLLTGAAELRRSLEENANRSAREWTDGVERALEDVERSLRREAESEWTADDLSKEQDRALLPSPGVERRSEGLQNELHDLIYKVRSLRSELMTARTTPGGVTAESASKARSLVLDLERFEKNETDLIQQSITQDIGAGD
jgi:hypothetical protein